MIAGHFGFAAGVKAKAPSIPLWALMLASQWLDVIFVPLLLMGVERLAANSGRQAGRVRRRGDPRRLHAFPGGGRRCSPRLFGALFLRAPRRAKRDRPGARCAVALVPGRSRFTAPTCRSCPGAPGTSPSSGSGCGSTRPLSAAVELLIVLAGAAMYWLRRARALRAGFAEEAACGAASHAKTSATRIRCSRPDRGQSLTPVAGRREAWRPRRPGDVGSTIGKRLAQLSWSSLTFSTRVMTASSAAAGCLRAAGTRGRACV